MSFILVTGAGGFIGGHLSKWLSSRNHIVAGIGHGNWSDAEVGARGLDYWLDSDLSLQGFERIYQEKGVPHTIFHLAGGSSVGAAFANPQDDFSRTVASTSVLLEWMRLRAPAASLVAVSSAAVYGSGYADKIAENATLTPFSPYGAHKLMMEVLCRSYAANFGLRVVTPRLFSVYGVELRKQLLWDLCNKMAQQGCIELGGSGDELRDWTHIDDVVRILESSTSLASEQAPVLNLATGVATPVHKIAAMVAEQWQDVSASPEITFSGEARKGDPFSLVADVSFMSAQGLECSRSLQQGIAEYVAWFRRQSEAN